MGVSDFLSVSSLSTFYVHISHNYNQTAGVSRLRVCRLCMTDNRGKFHLTFDDHNVSRKLDYSWLHAYTSHP